MGSSPASLAEDEGSRSEKEMNSVCVGCGKESIFNTGNKRSTLLRSRQH